MSKNLCEFCGKKRKTASTTTGVAAEGPVGLTWAKKQKIDIRVENVI